MRQVLIVDDSTSIRQLVSTVLERAGYEVDGAEDGREGLKVASAKEFDLVITDIHMPNMNGLELVEELRQLPTYRMKPILVLSTEGSQEMKERGKAAGATGWMVKPFQPDRMIETVGKVLR